MFHVKHEGPAAAELAWLTQTQIDRLARYERFLLERAIPAGAVAVGDADRLHRRHILDSLRGVPFLPDLARTACDLGSGAGLPGIPIAIAHPGLRVTLSERRRSRRALLELAAESVGIDNVTIAGRVEELNGPFDACLARAFSDAHGAWAAARRLLSPQGVLLYWAGVSGKAAAVRPPPGAWARAGSRDALAPGGPVVIMGRQ
jgi:16S rRNA (guanine527-N7)-methyltransferase